MENQHKKIKGYRDLSQQEIDLMNRIKDHAENTAKLLKEFASMREAGQSELAPMPREMYEESKRCLSLAKTNLQTGQMWFVRAVALPDSF